MSGIALILAGHGSHISPNTAGVVWNYVDRLRAWAVADEITACFWKEPPAFSHVLDTVVSDTVVIVPVFTAQGYFTQTVIPTEMGLNGAITHKNGKTVYYTPTIGEHPYLETIVQERVQDAVTQGNLNPADTSVAIIGHGTRRNRSSQDATRHQANQVRERQLVSQVVDVYLDDDPDIPSLYRSTTAKNIVAVPFFLAEGSHVTIDVPDALGITYGNYPDRVQGREVYYTPPVGTDDAICRVILELARDTGIEFDMFTSPPSPLSEPSERGNKVPLQCPGEGLREGLDHENTRWTGFPTAGRDTFSEALDTHDTLHFGQVMVTDEKVWHTDEASDTSTYRSPEALRGFIRENPFRPLPTSDDLPSGWQVDVASADEAYAVVETIYPTLITDWANQQNNTFITESLDEVGTRQVGMFEDIHRIEPIVIQNTVDSVCGRCIRQPTWLNEHQPVDAGLPCKTPCNVWLSSAKEQATGANDE